MSCVIELLVSIKMTKNGRPELNFNTFNISTNQTKSFTIKYIMLNFLNSSLLNLFQFSHFKSEPADG